MCLMYFSVAVSHITSIMIYTETDNSFTFCACLTPLSIRIPIGMPQRPGPALGPSPLLRSGHEQSQRLWQHPPTRLRGQRPRLLRKAAPLQGMRQGSSQLCQPDALPGNFSQRKDAKEGWQETDGIASVLFKEGWEMSVTTVSWRVQFGLLSIVPADSASVFSTVT